MEKFSSIEFPDIASEIIRMYEIDQDMREKNLQNDYWDEEVDRKNTKRMKEIVNEIGWPSISRVGSEASMSAWLLVQHADHDVEFQSHCLTLMKDLPEGEVGSENIAMLTDRVMINQGKPQVYGTQFKQVNGAHVPKDIEDIEHVDERRKSMGLDTLEENINRIKLKYPLK
jgi:hypothetical protein